jgi:hypothetical protein
MHRHRCSFTLPYDPDSATRDRDGPRPPASLDGTGTVTCMAGTPTLINLTRKPKFVAVNGVLFLLPEAPPPRVIQMSATNPPRTLTVRVGDVEIQLDDIDMVGTLVSVPPVLDSVLWLVDSDVFAQFPGRSDFVRPAAYRLTKVGELDCSSIDDSVLVEQALRAGSVRVLVRVSRSPLAASVDAERLEELEFVDAPMGLTDA